MQSLVLQDVSKRFPIGEVLGSISLAVKEGERIALVGESGSGKTTLLRIIAGLEQPSSGKIKLNELDVTGWPANRRGVGFVFQDYATYPRLTVAENLNASVPNTVNKAERESRLRETAGWLGLEEMLRRLPTELSGGQLQRIALGKALMARPKLLLLDEPFSQLDVRLAEQMRRLLQESHQRYGMTQVLVTHQPLDALCTVDKLAVLEKGKLVHFEAPCQVRQRPQTRFAAELTSPCGLNVIPTQAVDDSVLAGRSSIAFRPESVHLASATMPVATAHAIPFKCRLGGVHDLGIVRLREAYVGSHKILILCRPAQTNGSDDQSTSCDHLPLNEVVQCFVRHEDLLVFPS